MSYIIIDGYNLTGIAHKSLEKARNDIIEKLRSYSELKGHNITLVFDGWKSGQGIETRMRIDDVNIIYSKLGEKADFVIKKILSEDIKPWIVVSSDREISDFAGKKGFVSIASDEFEDKLNFALYPDEQEEIEYKAINRMPNRQKGNPMKLSKKQKKKLDALRKL